jgi:ribosome biogenesis GTPase
VLVANVDQLIIVTSAAEPRLKPNLIDRLLVTAEKGGIRPIICINKIDLIEPADLMPLVGVYAQLGYDVILASAISGIGVDRLGDWLAGAQSVVTGQSGVGKSSLLNAAEPGLDLRVQTVSDESQKGRHTTTTAELIPLSFGGYVVDTPGIRQFQLWDVIPEEVAGFFRLCGQGRGGRRLDRHAPLRELRANPLRRRGLKSSVSAVTSRGRRDRGSAEIVEWDRPATCSSNW